MRNHSPRSIFSLENWKTLLVVILPSFLIFLSYLYLAIYYSFFDISIFDYLTVNTLITHAVQSIGIVFFTSTAGLIFGITYELILNKFSKWFVDKGFYEKLYEKSKVLLAIILGTFIISFILSFFYFIFFIVHDIVEDDITHQLIKMSLSLLFISIISILFFSSRKAKKINYPNSNFYATDTLITILIVIITITTMYKAFLDARYFIQDQSYQYVLGEDLKGNYTEGKLKLIGKASDNYFFQLPNKAVEVKKYEDFENLIIYTQEENTD